MQPGRVLAAGLLAALLLPLPALAQEEVCEGPPEPPRPTEQEARAYFEWIDGLGFPDAWGRPLVAFTNGSCSGTEGGPWGPGVFHGFLLEDAGLSFRLFSMDLEVVDLVKSAGSSPHLAGGDRIGYSIADLDAIAAERLKEGRAAADAHSIVIPGPHNAGVWVPEPVRLLPLARTCWARDRRDLSRDLLHVAWRLARRGADRPMRGDLGEVLAPVLVGRTMMSLADPAVGRPSILARLDHIAAEFPDAEDGARARQGADLLRRMVAEDASHRPPEGFPDRCTAEERAREWVWRLRDQGGVQREQPGFCDVFAAEGKAREPADALLALGEQGVPALLDAFGDGRWTRGLEERFGCPLPFPIGSAARQILGHISGREFEEEETARAWWREVREKGMEKVLCEAVRRGDRESPEQAKVLMERFPGSAIPALVEGLRASSGWWERGYLAYLLGRIEGEGPVAALVEEVKSGPLLDGRIEAARALRDRGRPEGLAGMVNALRTMDLDSGVWRFDDLVEFLVESREAIAVRGLREGFTGLDVRGKLRILESVAAEARKDPLPSKEWRAEAEALFAAAIADGEPTWGPGQRFGEREVEDPRVRDVAAARLAELRGDPAATAIPVAPSRRDRWGIAILNGWRRERGLEPLAEPPQPPVPPPDPAVAGLLRTVRESADPWDRAAAVGSIRDLGLGSLVPTEEALREFPADHPSRAVLEGAVRELAFHIREAVADTNGLPAPEPVRGLLAGLQGMALRPEGVVGLLMESLRALPGEAEGVEFGLERTGDGTGVSLRIRILRPRRSPRGAGRAEPMWSQSETILVSGRVLHSRGSGATRYSADLPPASAWEPLAEALKEVLEVPPAEPVAVQVRVTRE